MIAGVFVVYVCMLLGGLPRLRLDRTSIALLGAIVLLASGAISPEEAVRDVDVPTLALLFGLMVVSAQPRLGGFYTRVAQRLTSHAASPARLLAAVVLGGGAVGGVQQRHRLPGHGARAGRAHCCGRSVRATLRSAP